MAKRIDITDLDIYYGKFKAVEGVRGPRFGDLVHRSVRLR
jgi:hypothetical protein